MSTRMPKDTVPVMLPRNPMSSGMSHYTMPRVLSRTDVSRRMS